MEDLNREEDQLQQNGQDQEGQEEEQEESKETPEGSSAEGSTEEGEDVETLKEKLERTAKENKELREYKKRAEKRLKQAQSRNAPESELSEIREELETFKIQQQNPEYTAEDIEDIKNFAKGAGISLSEAVQNQTLQAGIQAKIEQRKNEQASPKGKGRSSSKLNLEPSEIDLENPEHVQALKDNPELKKSFKEYMGKKFR